MRYYFKDSLLISKSNRARALFSSYKRGYRQVCLSGQRGCGKTVDLLLYALWLIKKNRNFRVNWARSEYSTIATTVIETLEQDIFKYPLGDSRNKHPKNPFRLIGGTERPKRMAFDNGSSLRFVGLDNKSKSRGSAADLNILN